MLALSISRMEKHKTDSRKIFFCNENLLTIKTVSDVVIQPGVAVGLAAVAESVVQDLVVSAPMPDDKRFWLLQTLPADGINLL